MKQMKRSETRDMSIFGKKNEKSITAKERDREREAKIMSEEARTEDLKSKIRDIDFSLKEFEEKK